jgi:predicted nucleic acid-binding protein
MLVIDASITAAWILPDERTDAAVEIERRVVAEGAVVPAIWTLEIASVLLMAERRGRTDAASVTKALAVLQDMPILVVPGSLAEDLTVVAALARDHRVTPYDAAYLALARGEGLELATLDRALADAARTLGVRALPSE